MDNKVDKFISDLRKWRIFGGNSDMIPVYKGTGNNGVSFSVMNKSVLYSVIWLLLSFSLFGYGFWHCRYRSPYYSFKCDSELCILQQNRDLPINIYREDIITCQTVRIDSNGKTVDTTSMRSKASRRLGHSVEISYNLGENKDSKYKVQKKLLFSNEDIGGGNAKTISKQILKGIYKKTEEINVKHGFAITALGLTSCIIGALSTILCLIFGQWADTPKRLKKGG